MKIAFIGLRSYPARFEGISGVDTRGQQIIDHLSRRNNIEEYIFVRNWTYKKTKRLRKNIYVWPLITVKNKYLDTFIYSLIATLFATIKPIETIFYEGTGSCLFCFVPKLFGKKIITTFHSVEWKRNKWGLLGKMVLRIAEKIAVTFSDSLMVVSKELKTYLWKQYRIKAKVASYYIEKKRHVCADIIKNKHNLKENGYVLFLGRFVPEKRVDWLIKAYLNVKTDKKLVLAGGSSHSEKYVKSLISLANKNPNIIFTKYVFGKEKEELLSNCHSFILPSEIEGFPISLFEALNYQKPVLVGNFYDMLRLIPSSLYIFHRHDFKSFMRKFKILLKKKPHLLTIKSPISKKVFLNSYNNFLVK